MHTSPEYSHSFFLERFLKNSSVIYKKALSLFLALLLISPWLSFYFPAAEAQNELISSGDKRASSISDTVNEITGDVSFPVELFSLPGKNGTDFSYSLNYNSNIQESVTSWNTEKPTGLTGLGWSGSQEVIWRDNNNSSNDTDDSFYIYINGDFSNLIKTGSDSEGDIYQLIKYQPWRIRHLSNDTTDTWTIIKEDGTKMIFGGDYTTDGNNQFTSTNGSIQWGVAWDNWIGSSSQITGQSQFPVAWSVAQVKNMWGESVDYSYYQEQHYVGQEGDERKKYTQASRLKDISNNNYIAEFDYQSKEFFEYQDPHTQPKNEGGEIRTVSGNISTSGVWDSLNPVGYYNYGPDPVVNVSVSGSNFNYTCPTYSGIDTESFSFNCTLPSNAPNDITVTVSATDDDSEFISWTSWDDTMWDSSSFNLSCNLPTVRQTEIQDQKPVVMSFSYNCASAVDEPDAYQERYDQHYLDNIRISKKINTDNILLYSTKLNYLKSSGAINFLTSSDNNNKMSKRLLTSISFFNPAGRQYSPSYQFSYWGQESGDNVSVSLRDDSNIFNSSTGALYGALKSVWLPSGAKNTYTYGQNDITTAERNINIRPANSNHNWSRPRVYWGSDYSLTSWQSTSHILLQPYTWNGRWVDGETEEYSIDNPDDIQINLKGWFYTTFRIDNDTPTVSISWKNPTVNGSWQTIEKTIPSNSTDIKNYKLVSGDNFIALLDEDGQTVYTTTWDGESWDKESNIDLLKKHIDIGATNNMLFIAEKRGQTLYPMLYRLENGFWQDPITLPGESSVFGRDIHITDIQMGAAFAVVALSEECEVGGNFRTPVFPVFHWDKGFTSLTQKNIDPSEAFSTYCDTNDGIPASVIGDNIYISHGRIGTSEGGSILARYDGVDWIQHNTNRAPLGGAITIDMASISGDEDLVDDYISYFQFNPNTTTWEELTDFQYVQTDYERLEFWIDFWFTLVQIEVELTAAILSTFFPPIAPFVELIAAGLDLAIALGQGLVDHELNKQIGAHPQSNSVSENYAAVNNGTNGKVYHKNTDDSWTYIGGLSASGLDDKSELSTLRSFTIYRDENGENYAQLFRNGTLTERLGYGNSGTLLSSMNNNNPEDYQSMVGAESFLAYPASEDNFRDADNFYLFREENDKITGSISDFVVSRVTVYNGISSTGIATDYQYDASSAVMSSSGGTAYYQEVTVIPSGNSSSVNKNNGFSQHFYYNNSPVNSSIAPPPNTINFCNSVTDSSTCTDITGENNTYAFGVPYLSRSCTNNNGQCNEVGRTEHSYSIYRQDLDKDNFHGYFMRPITVSATQDGSVSIVEMEYNAYGLLSSSTTSNYSINAPNASISNNVTNETYTTEYSYIQDKYSSSLTQLEQLNLLTPIVETVSSVSTVDDSGQTPSTTTNLAHTVSTWKNWNTSSNPQWAPYQEYSAVVESPSLFNWTSSSQNSDWLKTAEISNDLNATTGVTTEGFDRNGIYTSTLYDTSFTRPIAQFQNARVSQHQANYYGFEDYEDDSLWSMSSEETLPYNQMPPVHTGINALYSSENYVGIQPKYFSERDNETAYVVSAWVKPREGYSCTVGFASSSVTENSSTEPTWQFLQITIPAPVYSYNLPLVYCENGGSIDDVWFGPIDAPFSATTYETQYNLITAHISQNGETNRLLYNDKQEAITSINSNNQVSTIGGNSPGRCRYNNDLIGSCLTDLSSSNLNTLTGIVPRNGGFFDSFSNGEQARWQVDNTDSAVEVVNGTLWLTGNSSISYDENLTAEGYSIQLLPGANAPSSTINVKIGNSGISYNATYSSYQLSINGTNVGAAIKAPFAYHWVLVTVDNAIFFYADGQLLISDNSSSSVSGAVNISTTGSTSESTSFQSVAFLNDISLSQSFVDGMGNSVQTQTQETDSNILISEFIYDDLGRVENSTKMARQDGLIGIRPNFATGFGSNQQLSGDINNYYNGSYCFGINNAACESNDEGYPYSRQVYETNPSGRVVASALPGIDFAITNINDDTNVNVESYGPTETSNSILAQLGVSSSYEDNFTVSTSESPWSNPDHIPQTTISTQQGKVIAQQAGASSILPTTLNTTVTSFNPNGNTVQAFHPNYFSQNNQDDVSTISYNALQQITQQDNPDTHTTQFIYDINGNIRFSMDANGAAASPNIIKYSKYDTLGRVTETGYTDTTDWSEQTLQSYANINPNWPSNGKWKNRYYYDFNTTLNSARNTIGRLYKTETNTDYSENNIISEELFYNNDGYISAVRISSEQFPDKTYVILYNYNQVGNITSITYPALNEITTGENITVDNGDSSEVYQASDSINVESGVTINSGVSIITEAAESITLDNNITVNPDGQFIAYINNQASGGLDPLELNGPSIYYTYNTIGQMVGVGTEEEPYQYGKYNYYANGNIAQELLNNESQVRTFSYSSQGWLENIEDTHFNQTLCYTVDCQQGASALYQGGLITQTSMDYTFSGPKDYSYNYAYDTLGRLLTADANEINGSGLSASDYDLSVTYDANGNIETLNRGSDSYTYTKYDASDNNGPNQIKNTDGSSNTMYQYDKNGNTTSSTSKNLGDSNAITYDPFIQLSTQFTQDDGTEVSFTYGAQNQRVSKTNSSSNESTYYIHGLNNYPLLEKTIDENSFSSKRHIYGPTGLIAITENNQDTYFISKDNLGSTRVVSNSNNEVESYFNYMPFGGDMNGNSNEGDNSINYRYTGQEYDSDLDLYNYRARFYDTELARFYAPDPALQYFSPYIYVGNNPINGIDPTGMVGISTVIRVASAGIRLASIGVRVGTDIYHIVEDPSNPMAWLGLGMDLLSGGLTAFHGASEVIGEVRSVENAENSVNSLSCPLGNSFTGKTLVETLNGKKPIKDINTKDKVLAYNEKKQKMGYYPVTELLSHELEGDEGLLVIHFGDTSVETTLEHPFWVENQGWKLAENLQTGDLLLSADLKLYPITHIEEKNSTEHVYNFEVAEAHNYFITEQELLVHNPCSPNGPSQEITIAPESLDALENRNLQFNNGHFRAYTGVIDDSTGKAYVAPVLYRHPVTRITTLEPNFNIDGPEGYTVNGASGTPIYHSIKDSVTYRRKNSWFWSWFYGEYTEVTMPKDNPLQKTSHYQISEMAGLSKEGRVTFPEGVGFAITMRDMDLKYIELRFKSCTLQGVNFLRPGFPLGSADLAPLVWREAITDTFINAGYTIIPPIPPAPPLPH